MPLRIDTLLDNRYTLVKHLGEGGQGMVWRVRDELNPERALAAKLVPRFGRSRAQLERARDEARQLSRLDDPSIVQVYGMFEDLQHDVLGLVMSYIVGESLDTAIYEGTLTSRHSWWVLRHLTAALAAVHARGLIHRDVKPENVMLADDFWVRPEDPKQLKLVDFGIAVPVAGQPQTLPGHVTGTVPYIAPERIDPIHFPSPPGPPQDLFALGVLAWQLFGNQDHPTGLAMHAELTDFAQAYREAASTTWPPPTGDSALDRLLRVTLPLHAGPRARDAGELISLVDVLLEQGRDTSLPGRASSVSGAGGGDTNLDFGPVTQSAPGARTDASLPTTEDHAAPAHSPLILSSPGASSPRQPPPPRTSSPRQPPPPRASRQPSQGKGSWVLQPPTGKPSIPTTNAGVALPTQPSATSQRAPSSAGERTSQEPPHVPSDLLTTSGVQVASEHNARLWIALGGSSAALVALVLLSAGVIAAMVWFFSNYEPAWSTSANPPPPQSVPQAPPLPAPEPEPQPAPQQPAPEVVVEPAPLLFDEPAPHPTPAAPALQPAPLPLVAKYADRCKGRPLCSEKCCPSGFDCNGPCKEDIPSGERFRLRYGGGGDGKVSLERSVIGGKLCVTLSDTRRRMCVPVTEGDVTLKTRLPVTAGDFARGVDVRVYDAKGKLIASRTNYRRSFTRGVVCEGILMKGFSGDPRVKLVSFFLDPSAHTPRHCENGKLTSG